MTAVKKKKDVAAAIASAEAEIMELTTRLTELRKQATPVPVKDYKFTDLNGPVTLGQLFGDKDILFAIHNMGQGCRYCTLWADGFNGLLPHLEDRFAVVLLSKDAPELQRRFANTRGWRFRMASHGGGAYIREQSTAPGGDNVPGLVCYERRGGKIFRKNAALFGPNDRFCPLWPIIGLAGLGMGDWTAQYSYWKRPAKGEMDDGGEDVR
jgi:predicted dithiol-disulfide oxidoreductase (DUF899 family)